MNIYFKDEFEIALNTIKADQSTIEKAKKIVLENISTKNKERKFTYMKYAATACVAFLLVLGGFGIYMDINAPTDAIIPIDMLTDAIVPTNTIVPIDAIVPIAYINIEINPSIELSVSRYDKVISADAYNSDGEAILEGLKIIACDVETAMEGIINSAIDKGYIAEDGSTVVSVTVSAESGDDAERLENNAEFGVEKAIDSSDLSATVHKDAVTPEFRLMALEQGVTPGKMNLIEKLKVLNPGIDIEEYKSMDVKDLLEMILKSGKNLNISVDTSINDGITKPPADVPSYGWVSTRLEQIRDVAFGNNAYEITLHYKAWHDDPAITELNDVNINIELPDGITPELYGTTELEYDKTANMLTKHINSVSTSSNVDYKEIFTVRITDTLVKDRYTIVSNVKIGGNPEDFTSYIVLELGGSFVDEDEHPEGNPPVGSGGGGNNDIIEDSYIITTEGVRINKSGTRPIPSYTAFVNADKNVGDFNIYVKSTCAINSDVAFTVLGNTYPAVLDSEGYWTATITGLVGYGEVGIMININGKQTSVGKLLILFAE